MESEENKIEKLPELNDRQELFCREYLIDFNGTQAAIRAGYSEDSAASIACENLIKPYIANRIEELKANIFEAVGLTQAQIYRELKRLATYDLRKAYNKEGGLKSIHEIDDDTAAAMVGIDVDELWEYNPASQVKEQTGFTKKAKFADKLNALNQLVKIAGWAAPVKSEITGANGVPLQAAQIVILPPKDDFSIKEGE